MSTLSEGGGMSSNRSLTPGQRASLEQLLKAEKQRILNSMEEKTGQINFQQSESKDSVDEASQNIILSQTTRLTNRENLYLKKIINALRQVEEGKLRAMRGTVGPIFPTGASRPGSPALFVSFARKRVKVRSSRAFLVANPSP